MKTMTFLEAFNKAQESGERAFRVCEAHHKHMFKEVYPQLLASGMTHQRALSKIKRYINTNREKVYAKHDKRRKRYYKSITR